MRLTKEQRILNTVKGLNLDDNSVDLMKYLISISINGIVSGFVYMMDEVRKKVFADNHHHMVYAYKNLLDSGLITLQGTNLIILAWTKPEKLYQTNLIYNNNTTKNRKYSRVVDKQIYMSNLDEADTHSSEEQINFTWNKVKGIIVPRTMAGLFTRKIYESEKTGLDMSWVLAEEERRQLDKEEIRFLCGLIAQCNTYGQIRDYNTHYAIKVMQELFEDSSFAISTGYRVQDQLISKGIIQIRKVNEGRKVLIINDYAGGFGPGKNYVVLPYAIFRTIFKQLELAAINLFFEQVFQLNNGENGKGSINANKKVNLKVISAPMDAKTEKEKLYRLRNWLRKRNDSEVFKLIYDLQAFFDIEDAGHGNVTFRIKRMYFVLKNAVRNKEGMFDSIKRYPRKAMIIKEVLLANNVRIGINDLRGLTDVFVHIDAHVTRRLVKILAMDINDRQLHGRHAIKSMAAYAANLYEQYKAGVGKAISNTVAYIASLRNEALDRLSSTVEIY